MEENQIKVILRKYALFQSCNADELNEIYKNIALVNHSQGEVLINEGDLADALYLIVQGSVQVFTTDENGENVILARLDEEHLFGEQAYLNNLIRTASIRAFTDVKLIKINYDILDKLFKRSEKLRLYLQKVSLDLCLSNLLQQLSSIESFVKDLFLKKSFFSSKEGVSIQHFKQDAIIFKKDDPPDFVYFISHGAIHLSFEDAENDLIINKNQMFGEVGVMHDKPRSATAIASTDTRLIAVSAKNFLNAIKKANNLKSMVVSFNQVYALPRNKAIAEQFIGNFEGNEAVFTKYKLSNGQIALCAKVINQAIFTIKIPDHPITETLRYKKGDLIQRTIQLHDNVIVGLTAFGEWDQINILCSMLFDGIKIYGCDSEAFSKSGNLLSLSSNSPMQSKEQGIICNCMSVTYQVLKDKIDAGYKQLAALSQETGACTACGSCQNKILDMLGQSSWLSATLELNQKFGTDVASFIIKPLYSQFVSFRAGQYIVLKLQINGLWIERAYTLVSSENNPGHYEVMIKKNPDGAFSQWLFSHATEKLFIWISSPNGKFMLNRPLNKSMLGFAAGIGITPFIAFLRTLKEENHAIKFYIIYTIQDQDKNAIPKDLEAYLDGKNNIQIELWDSSIKGRLREDAIEKIIEKRQAEQVYLCGPDPFMNMITEKLNNMQFKSEHIYKEQFLPAV